MSHIVIAAILAGVTSLPDPPNRGFGDGLFGVAIMSWSTFNALGYTVAILNFVYGIVEICS